MTSLASSAGSGDITTDAPAAAEEAAIAEVKRLKAEGNEAFAQKKYADAEARYTAAIVLAEKCVASAASESNEVAGKLARHVRFHAVILCFRHCTSQ